MGDFNVPNIDCVNHTPTSVADSYRKSFVKAVQESFLTQHVTVPTRENAVLDLIFSSEPDLVSIVDAIGNLENSNHTMLFKLHLQCASADKRGTRRDYNRGDYNSIRNALKLVDWSALSNCSVEEYWIQFKAIITRLEERYIPLKAFNSNQSKKPIWMTHKSWKSVKRKYKVFSRYENKDQPAVKEANSTARKELRKAQKNLEKKLAKNIKQDSKSFYSYVRSKSKAKVQISSLKNESGTVLVKDQDMASCFNTFFSSVFTQDNHEVPRSIDMRSSEDCTDIQFSENDILNILNRLKTDKSPGPDELLPRLLSEVKKKK